MQPLPEIQARLAAAVLAGRLDCLDDVVAGDRLRPAQRLQIYRNHFRTTLVEALAANFPATQRLIGEACFAGLARLFITDSPPRDPRLFLYGKAFPCFLGLRDELRGVPYAGGLAHLERAMVEASHAPDEPVLNAERLSRLSAQQLSRLAPRLHAAWRLVVSPWPLVPIWKACQPDAPEDLAVDLEAGATRLLIGRDVDGEIVWLPLDPAHLAFLRRIKAGRSPTEAAKAAAARAIPFDLPAMLACLIEAGALAVPES